MNIFSTVIRTAIDSELFNFVSPIDLGVKKNIVITIPNTPALLITYPDIDDSIRITTNTYSEDTSCVAYVLN